MSLTLLPAVDVRDGKAVRLRQGESGSETDYGSPLEAARTWVEAGAELAREPRSAECRRRCQRPVAADEFGTIAGDAARNDDR